MDGDQDEAFQGQAVVIQLDTDIDVARGAVLSGPIPSPIVARSLETRLVWLNETAYDPRGSYLLRTSTDLTPVSSLEIRALLDLATLEDAPVIGLRRQRHRHRSRRPCARRGRRYVQGCARDRQLPVG